MNLIEYQRNWGVQDPPDWCTIKPFVHVVKEYNMNTIKLVVVDFFVSAFCAFVFAIVVALTRLADLTWHLFVVPDGAVAFVSITVWVLGFLGILFMQGANRGAL